jgi:hypothetical protein
MPVLMDNRAAPSVQLISSYDVRTPASEALVRSWSSNSVEKAEREETATGAQRFPMPSDPQWSHFNQRRARLIRRQVRSGLSRVEEEELIYLQRETLAAVERAFPRPPVNLRLLASLEERLGNGTEMETM